MKTYFIHKDGQQSGPFTIAELRQLQITRSTPVWCDGMDGWEMAIAIEELQLLFMSTPPPMANFKAATPPLYNTKVELPEEVTDEEQPGKKNNTWVYVSFVLLACFSIGLFTYQQIQINGLESVVIEKTDSIKELKRISTGQSQALNDITQEQEMRVQANRLESLKKQLANATAELKNAKDKLTQLNDSEPTGSAEERIEQVQSQEGVIKALESQIEQINKEMSELKTVE